MKNLTLVFTAVFALVSIQSCRYSEEYQSVDVKNEFSLSVPSWMKPEEKLAPGALLEYANRYRNVYLVGFSQPADTATLSFEAYTRSGLDSLRVYLSKPLVADSQVVEINGLKGVRVELFGEMTQEKIYFSEVYLQSATKFYHFSVWTRGEDRKLKYKDDISKIISSIKPL